MYTQTHKYTQLNTQGYLFNEFKVLKSRNKKSIEKILQVYVFDFSVKLSWKITFFQQIYMEIRDLSKQFWCPVGGTKNSIS